MAPHSRIKLIGLGGVGCAVLHYLAVFLRSLCRPVRLVLIDGDQIEYKNLSRTAYRGLGNKAEEQAAEVASILRDSPVAVVPMPVYVGKANISQLIRSGDHVFLCVDNHGTRKLAAEHCATLADVALFSGGNDSVAPPRQLGTYGSVQVVLRRGGKDLTVPLTRYHPEIARAEGTLPGDADCAQQAASMPQILFANLAVASAMLNAFFAYSCSRLTYQEVQFDILAARSIPHFPLDADHVPEPLPPPPL